MRKRILSLGMLLLMCLCSFAQDAQGNGSEGQLMSPERVFFVPHWFVRAHGGVAYDVGEASGSHLISPAIQLSLGYKFNEYFALRGSFNGLWARNRYAYPEQSYKWNFIQPSVEAELDLTTLFFGKKPDRELSLYAFTGIGANCAFNNDDAMEGAKTYPNTFQKLWKNSRWFAAFRFGLGADYRVTDAVALSAELSGNLLSDHFNSKKGKNDNVDWHLNALVGVKFILGQSYGKLPAVYAPPTIEPKPEPKPDSSFVDVPIEKISFNVNIHFLINQSIIRSNQMPKLVALLRYLNDHPRSFIRLSGFADKETGNPTINMRLSRERSQAVSDFLQDAGIQEWRIRRFAKGDKVQPFDIPEDNRVCICFVYDPDNPVPQAFEY